MEDGISNSSPRYHIRKMLPQETTQAVDIFGQHGLHEGRHSVVSFLQIDPNAFYIAVNDDNDGEIIGCCGAPFTNPEFAFLGLYAVKKGYQGKGIGTQVFQAVMDYVGNRNVGLASVPDKIHLYRDKLGFKVPEKHHMIVQMGKIDLQQFQRHLSEDDISSVKVQSLDCESESIWPLIFDYDSKLFSYQRDKKLLRLCLTEPNSYSMIALNSQGHSVGFGCVKEDSGGHAMLAPLYADNETIALILIINLLAKYTKANPSCHDTVMYILHSNSQAMRLVKKLNFESHEECPRFFTKSTIDFDYNKLYGILSPNFSL